MVSCKRCYFHTFPTRSPPMSPPNFRRIFRLRKLAFTRKCYLTQITFQHHSCKLGFPIKLLSDPSNLSNTKQKIWYRHFQRNDDRLQKSPSNTALSKLILEIRENLPTFYIHCTLYKQWIETSNMSIHLSLKSHL